MSQSSCFSALPAARTKDAGSRARAPKTRGGCITCKARHVKCDETKPSCKRCLRFWGKCDGYSASPPKQRRISKPATSEVIHPLLPRLKSSNGVILYETLPTESFRNGKEHRFFMAFRNETVAALPGLFTSSLWETLILQACHEEQFVRDAAIAIGALSSCERKLIEEHSPTNSTLTGTEAYRFALQQYGHAVKFMRKAIMNSTSHLRKALIGCLLVICFESLQGNYVQALTHAVSGHKLLQDWLEKQAHPEPNNAGLTSPNSLLIEDELVDAFSRLDLQIMAYVDPRPASFHEKLKSEGATAVQRMPALFQDVQEARMYWELVQRRSSHFIAVVAAQSMQHGAAVRTLAVDLGIGSEVPLVRYHAESEVPLVDFQSEAYNAGSADGVRAEYRRYRGEIARWFLAFKSFYAALDRRIDERVWTAATLIYVHAKTSEIMFLSSFFSDECSLDRFISEFREITNLSRCIFQSRFFRGGEFKFDLGIVNPLRLVGKWCRDGRVRRDAIGLLRESRVREGLYDGLIMARVEEWIMKMEEEGLEDVLGGDSDWVGVEAALIPEERRYRVTGVKLDCLRRRSEVEAERLGKSADGRTERRRTIICW